MPLVREPGALAPYQQIRDILRKEILERMSAGDRIAPERDLAKRFGANRATVSRAISHLVNEGLLVRQVGRGTFVAGGGNGRTRTVTRTVSLIVPLMHGKFPSTMMRGAIRGLRDHNYRAVLFDSENSAVAESAELDRQAQEGIDGALLMPAQTPENIPLFARLQRLAFPLVFLDRRPVGFEADLACSDHYWGAHEATSRLIARGHTRIAHFTSFAEQESSSVRDRLLGYEQALTDHGIEVDPELICPPAVYSENQSVYKHILAYLRHGDRPITAVFGLSDLFALATIAACRDLNLSIPKDLELASFFDGELDPMTSIPFLKVVQRQEDIGRLAVDLLMSRISGNGPEGPQTIKVRPDIIDEVSSAPKS